MLVEFPLPRGKIIEEESFDIQPDRPTALRIKTSVASFNYKSSPSTTKQNIMKCKQNNSSVRPQIYFTLIALFILIATLSSTFSANSSTTSILVSAEEMSSECLDKCGETCDIIRKSSRITCFSKCLANCLT